MDKWHLLFIPPPEFEYLENRKDSGAQSICVMEHPLCNFRDPDLSPHMCPMAVNWTLLPANCLLLVAPATTCNTPPILPLALCSYNPFPWMKFLLSPCFLVSVSYLVFKAQLKFWLLQEAFFLIHHHHLFDTDTDNSYQQLNSHCASSKVEVSCGVSVSSPNNLLL